MARIGGAFPFPTAQASEGGGRFSLGPGGVFYPPAGQYLIETDANSVVEVFDPVQGQWQTWVIATNGENVTVDGVNWRIRNSTGSLNNSITIVSAGSNGTNGIGIGFATVTFSGAPATSGVTASGYVVVGGAVSGVAVTSGGSGWVVPPLVVFDPPPQGGLQATAFAVVSAGTISGIVMVSSGGGYPVAPNVWLIPQTNVYQGASVGGLAAGTIPPAGFVNQTNAVPGNVNTIGGVSGTLLTVSSSLGGSGTIVGVKLTNNGGGYANGTVSGTIAGTVAGGVVSGSATAPLNATVYLQPRVMQ